MALTETDVDTLHLLADVATSFAKPDPERVRSLRDAGGHVDREMWSRLAENGWLGILVDEELGGAGLGLDAAVTVAERLGYAGFPEPFAAGAVLAPLVLAAADAGPRDRPLADVLGGRALVGVATSAEVTRSGARLAGRARFVGVAGADAWVLPVADGDGVALYAVTAGTAGLTVADEPRADGTLSASLDLRDVEAELLVDATRGRRVLGAATDATLIVAAAELVGLMDRVLEMTLEYLGQRRQFGKPIGSFQVLQHRAVDVWMQRELARAALVNAVAVHLDSDTTAEQRSAASSSAKARAALAAPELCRAALQLHGAIGFTDEYDLGIYLNRALAMAPWLGNGVTHRRRYAQLTDRLKEHA